MPFRSKSQWRRFGAMLRRGEISKAKFKEWTHASPSYKSLPERIGKRKEAARRVLKRKKRAGRKTTRKQ